MFHYKVSKTTIRNQFGDFSARIPLSNITKILTMLINYWQTKSKMIFSLQLLPLHDMFSIWVSTKTQEFNVW